MRTHKNQFEQEHLDRYDALRILKALKEEAPAPEFRPVRDEDLENPAGRNFRINVNGTERIVRLIKIEGGRFRPFPRGEVENIGRENIVGIEEI